MAHKNRIPKNGEILHQSPSDRKTFASEVSGDVYEGWDVAFVGADRSKEYCKPFIETTGPNRLSRLAQRMIGREYQSLASATVWARQSHHKTDPADALTQIEVYETRTKKRRTRYLNDDEVTRPERMFRKLPKKTILKVGTAASVAVFGFGTSGDRLDDSALHQRINDTAVTAIQDLSFRDQFETLFADGRAALPNVDEGEYSDDIFSRGLAHQIAKADDIEIEVGEKCLALTGFDTTVDNGSVFIIGAEGDTATVVSAGGEKLNFDSSRSVIIPADDATRETLKGNKCDVEGVTIGWDFDSQSIEIPYSVLNPES